MLFLVSTWCNLRLRTEYTAINFKVWNELIKNACSNRIIGFGKVVVNLKPHEPTVCEGEIKSTLLKFQERSSNVRQAESQCVCACVCVWHVDVVCNRRKKKKKKQKARGHTLMGTGRREHSVLWWLQPLVAEWVKWAMRCCLQHVYGPAITSCTGERYETWLNKTVCNGTKRSPTVSP